MKKILFTILGVVLCGAVLCAEDPGVNSLTAADAGKDSLSISGWFAGAYEGKFISASIPQYLLDYYTYAPSDFINSLSLGLYLYAEYNTEYLGFSLKSYTNATTDTLVFQLNELSGTVNISPNLSFSLGKIVYSWGKGYAFSAVGFVNPAKDPRAPDLPVPGLVSLETELLFSLPSDFFRTFSASFIVIPGNIAVDGSFTIADTDLALKVSFLIADIDIDLLGYYDGAGGHKAGADFAFNLFENIEVHAEGAYCASTSKTLFESVPPVTAQAESWQALFGLRYLSPWNTTVILEFYHNSAGYAPSEYAEVLAYVEGAMGSSIPAQINAARGQAMPVLARPTAMQNYLNLKIMQPEPFDLLYFTPSLSLLWNLDDLSLSGNVSFSYKPVDNLEFILTASSALGGVNTEMGSKPNPFQIDFELDLYF
jgi:hypothetical protein